MTTDLAKGTEVFSPTGSRSTVAVDRRSKKGRLWLQSEWSEKHRNEARGVWLPVEGNEELLAFCRETQERTKPLSGQADALHHRIAEIRRFALLTATIVAGQSITLYDIGPKLEDSGKVREQIGDGLDTTEYFPRYTGTLPEGIGGPLRVSGSKGSLDIPPPDDLVGIIS